MSIIKRLSVKLLSRCYLCSGPGQGLDSKSYASTIISSHWSRVLIATHNNITNMNLKPLGDRVIIEPVEKKNAGKTKSGLYLPETADNEGQEEERSLR